MRSQCGTLGSHQSELQRRWFGWNRCPVRDFTGHIVAMFRRNMRPRPGTGVSLLTRRAIGKM